MTKQIETGDGERGVTNAGVIALLKLLELQCTISQTLFGGMEFEAFQFSMYQNKQSFVHKRHLKNSLDKSISRSNLQTQNP